MLTTLVSASDFLFDPVKASTEHKSPYIVVKVFVIATVFQEFTSIMKYCPLTSSLGAHSLASISCKQKKISKVFRTYEYPKSCSQINFHT